MTCGVDSVSARKIKLSKAIVSNCGAANNRKIQSRHTPPRVRVRQSEQHGQILTQGQKLVDVRRESVALCICALHPKS
eukprot:15366492-Ditylum_brightwellii.AAC.2